MTAHQEHDLRIGRSNATSQKTDELAVEVAARSGMVLVGRACLVRFKRDSRGLGPFGACACA